MNISSCRSTTPRTADDKPPAERVEELGKALLSHDADRKALDAEVEKHGKYGVAQPLWDAEGDSRFRLIELLWLHRHFLLRQAIATTAVTEALKELMESVTLADPGVYDLEPAEDAVATAEGREPDPTKGRVG